MCGALCGTFASFARVTGEARLDAQPLALNTCARGRRLSAFDLFLLPFVHGPTGRGPARAPALLRLRSASGHADVTVLTNARVERLCFDARASAPRVSVLAVRFRNCGPIQSARVRDEGQVRPATSAHSA